MNGSIFVCVIKKKGVNIRFLLGRTTPKCETCETAAASRTLFVFLCRKSKGEPPGKAIPLIALEISIQDSSLHFPLT